MVRNCYAILIAHGWSLQAPKLAHKLAKMIFPDRHDPPVGVIPDECGECATNSRWRAKRAPSWRSPCAQAVKPLYRRSFWLPAAA